MMKNTAILATAFALSLPANAAEAPLWQQGEKLTYSVSFGLLRAGTAVFSYAPDIEQNSYEIHVTAQTEGFARRIFKLNDTLTINGVLAGSFSHQPTTMDLVLNEADYSAHKTIQYPAYLPTDEEHHALYHNKKASESAETVTVEAETRDLLSALYHLRQVAGGNIEELSVGSRYTLPVLTSSTPYSMDVIITDKQKLQTLFGQKLMYHVEPQNTSASEKFSGRDQRPWGAWVLADNTLTPMSIDVHLKAGTFKARLKQTACAIAPQRTMPCITKSKSKQFTYN